ncbi:hypothetical protein RUM44_009298 [Polyplax serrata]|uniref:Uncharacterized protein n=1 Tax=Polyplax serrata TaxID=468196 RepID=A0ABR1AS97_POLSC
MSKRDVSSPRRRYARSSTTSVTQLLSDSCSSLLHRLTGRVRGPSQVTEGTAATRIRNHVDIYSDIQSSRRDYWQKLIDSEKKHKTENSKIKRDRTEALKSDFKSSVSGVVKNSCEKSFEQNVKSEVDENSIRKRINEVNRETSLANKRGYRVYPEEVRINKNADEKQPAKSRLLEDLSLNSLGTTRMRLENKYSEALNKVVKRKRDLQRAPSPGEFKFELTKSATTANILLSEKAYPFVSSPLAAPRDKTPFRIGDEPTRSRRHKSYKDELHPTYRKSGPLRTDGSGISGLSSKPYLKICSIDIDKEDDKSSNGADYNGGGSVTPKQETSKNLTETSSAIDEVVAEREVKRKEIQSLINKYAMLDEAYNRLGGKVQKSKTREMTLKHSASTQTILRSKMATVSRWFWCVLSAIVKTRDTKSRRFLGKKVTYEKGGLPMMCKYVMMTKNRLHV